MLKFIAVLLILTLVVDGGISALMTLVFIPTVANFVTTFVGTPGIVVRTTRTTTRGTKATCIRPIVAFNAHFAGTLSVLDTSCVNGNLDDVITANIVFVFTVLFFDAYSSTNIFSPVVGHVLGFANRSPIGIYVNAFLVNYVYRLSNSNTAAFLVTVPTYVPLFRGLGVGL